jgi:CHASE3 domain sensor protein/GAF domain-containing protein
MNIGSKLTIAFGLLVVLTLLVIGLSYYASNEAIEKIRSTGRQRVPSALASSHAQADLLRMFSAVRGYLALGDDQFLENYSEAEQAFQDDLDRLDTLSTAFDETNKERLRQLKQDFEQWQELPAQLFELRDERMEREPAYAWVNTEGTTLAGKGVLINISLMIEEQARREPSNINNTLMEDMANFQSSFAAMFSGLRGYVMTRNPNFRNYEYNENLVLNEEHWQQLKGLRSYLNPQQREYLNEIETSREQFIQEVPVEAFQILENENYEWRRDLYLFNTEIEPLRLNMQTLLTEIANSQQEQMVSELNEGSEGLNNAVIQTIWGGIAAVVLGILLAFIFRQTIAGPVRRLTGVANQIRGGDLNAEAPIESGDEIGVFAETFNSMTSQLRETLLQIRKEKKRADDLLHVVIPIGIALSSEKDFNRLLQNMLVEAMTFCHADGGAIFLREGECLRLMMLRNTSQGVDVSTDTRDSMPETIQQVKLYQEQTGEPNHHNHVAYTVLNATSINVPNTYEDRSFEYSGLRGFDELYNYRTVSLLDIPLGNSQKKILGVLELFNAQDPETNDKIPFDLNLQQMMESFSSLAVAALESYIREQALRQEIQQLRIEIDEARRQQQVSEIVDTDFFQDLRSKARDLRRRGRRGESNSPEGDTSNS